MADSQILEFILKAKDEASAVIENFSDKTLKAENRMAGLTKASGLAVAGVAALTAALVASANQAIAFETQMANVSTLISGDSTQAIAELSDGVLELANRMPKSVDELGGSLYDILSAGVEGSAQQMAVLESSAKLATAGLGDTAGATNIMTSAINAFQLDAKDAEQIADTLFQTVKYGKTTVDQMAQAFGATAPTVAAAGFSLDEFSAATAALTTTGMPAAQAQNSLRQTVVALTKPTKEMSELFKQLGYEDLPAYVQAMKDADEGDVLGSLLRGINEAAEGNAETLTKAFGSVEAYSAALGIGVTVADSYVDTLNSMGNGTETLNEAFEKQKATVASSGQILKNNIQTVAIEIGSVLLPILADLTNWIVESVIPTLKEWGHYLNENRPLLYAIAIGLTAAMIPAIWAAVAAIGAATIAALPWIAIMVAVGVAVGAMAYLIITHWDTIKEAFTKGYNWVIERLVAISDYIKSLPEKWKEWGRNLGNAFVDAIMEKFNALADKIKGSLEAAANFLRGHSPPLAGPFKEIDTWGYNVGDAWIEGMRDALSQPILPATINAGALQTGAGLSQLPTNTTNNSSSINVTQNIYNDVDLDHANQELLFMLENRARY